MDLVSPGAEAWPLPEGPRNSGQSARVAGPPKANTANVKRGANLLGMTQLNAWPKTKNELRSRFMAKG